MSPSKRQGLVLDDPGAPYTPHTVPGIPGYYRRDIPTPVGEDGELTLEAAQEFDKDKSIPLKLVPVDDVEAAEKLAADTLKEIRNVKPAGLAGAEVARFQDEKQSQKGAN